MAGTIIADYIRADANKLSLNVGNTIVASINSSGILSNTGGVIITPTGIIGANAVVTNSIAEGAISRTKFGFAGAILQALQAVKVDASSFGVTTWTDVSGLSIDITPTSSSSKFIVFGNISTGTSSANSGRGFRLVRNGSVPSGSVGNTALGNLQGIVGDFAPQHTNSMGVSSFTFIDSPATTSALTYKIQAYNTNNTLYVNRVTGAGSSSYFSPISAITVLEITG